MKFEIMTSILFELLAKKTVKANYLAKKHGVNIRTIYRYIDTLSLAGVPIYTIRGYNGGFSIMDTFKLSSTFMTRQEFEQTINALTSFNSSLPTKELTSAINKLKATTKNEFSTLNMRSGSLVIDGSPWGDTKGYKSKLAVLGKSIEENKKIFIRYRDRNGEITERTILPYFILFKQGIWYVFAYCELRRAYRFFKTGRIEFANITNETFIKENIDQEKINYNFWKNNTMTTPVSLSISKKCLSDVEEWLGVENITQINNEYFANAELPIDDGLISKIMSYGKGIKVISPESLIEKIKSVAQQVVNSY